MRRDLERSQAAYSRAAESLFTSRHAMLENQVDSLEQEIGYLRDKLAGYLTGQWTVCAAPGCNQYVGDRLLLGQATCSETCTARMRALRPKLPRSKAALPDPMAENGRGIN